MGPERRENLSTIGKIKEEISQLAGRPIKGKEREFKKGDN
jgi:hypothetical protein